MKDFFARLWEWICDNGEDIAFYAVLVAAAAAALALSFGAAIPAIGLVGAARLIDRNETGSRPVPVSAGTRPATRDRSAGMTYHQLREAMEARNNSINRQNQAGLVEIINQYHPQLANNLSGGARRVATAAGVVAVGGAVVHLATQEGERRADERNARVLEGVNQQLAGAQADNARIRQDAENAALRTNAVMNNLEEVYARLNHVSNAHQRDQDVVNANRVAQEARNLATDQQINQLNTNVGSVRARVNALENNTAGQSNTVTTPTPRP